MNLVERREWILRKIEEAGSISIHELSLQLPNISEMTIRRDLEALDQERRLVRIHGGARSLSQLVGTDGYFGQREQRHVAEKFTIAQRAAEIVRPNMSIFLDSGSTAMALAQALPDEKYLIFTTGINCAIELAALEQPDVHLIGGRVNKSSYSASGSTSIDIVSRLNFDLSFIGVVGYTPGEGFNTGSGEEAMLKQQVIRRSERCCILMDSSKYGVVTTFQVATLEDIDFLATDDGVPKALLQELQKAKVKLLL